MKTRTKKRKATTIQTSLSPEEHERFIGHVRAIDRSVADVLREAVSFYLDQSAKQPVLPLDYDDIGPERRTPRHLWGG